MVHMLGALLLIAGGGLTGAAMTEPLRRRSRALGEMGEGLLLLEQELELGGLTLARIMDRLEARTTGTAGELFSACGKALTQPDRDPFPLLWERLVSDCEELGPEGMEALTALGGSLGRCDAEEQCRAVAVVRLRLDRLRQQNDSARPVRERLCHALGLSGGVLAAIFLM